MAYYFVVLINLPNDTYLVSLLGLPLNLSFNLQQECQFWNSHLGIERYVLVALKMTRVCFCTSAKARGPCQKSSSIILHFIFWDRVYTDPNTICLNWLNRKQLGNSCPFFPVLELQVFLSMPGLVHEYPLSQLSSPGL